MAVTIQLGEEQKQALNQKLFGGEKFVNVEDAKSSFNRLLAFVEEMGEQGFDSEMTINISLRVRPAV